MDVCLAVHVPSLLFSLLTLERPCTLHVDTLKNSSYLLDHGKIIPGEFSSHWETSLSFNSYGPCVDMDLGLGN